MYERVVLKTGEVIWMKIGERFCRRDIALARFEHWSEAREVNRNYQGVLA